MIIYRLCTMNSFESRMLEKATHKRKLEKIVIHKERFKKIDNETMQIQLAEVSEILNAEGEALLTRYHHTKHPRSLLFYFSW